MIFFWNNQTHLPSRNSQAMIAVFSGFGAASMWDWMIVYCYCYIKYGQLYDILTSLLACKFFPCNIQFLLGRKTHKNLSQGCVSLNKTCQPATLENGNIFIWNYSVLTKRKVLSRQRNRLCVLNYYFIFMCVPCDESMKVPWDRPRHPMTLSTRQSGIENETRIIVFYFDIFKLIFALHFH